MTGDVAMDDVATKGSQAMKITVDTDKCCGYGDCELAAPELLELGEDGIARVISGAEPGEARAREAAGACPVAAIDVEPAS
ncbi:ferredoxin [Streptomyces sp. NPDC007875]|uniref:ferredoxin n=2 Tax=unclassified Streptomyces TaxID=2593676 RepID=UPI0036B0BDBF